MEQVDTYIANINKVICSNISAFCNVSRGFLSQNILSQLRNLVDHTALKAFSNGRDIAITYQNIEQANQFVHTKGNLNFCSNSPGCCKSERFNDVIAIEYTSLPSS